MIPAAVSEEYRCLVEILTCLVCKGLVTQAHICPNCSKFYCLPCIRRQLALEEKCLHCSKQLSPAALSNCEDLCCDLRETLEKVKLRASESARAPQDKSPYYCYAHKLEKTYYCQTCERPLCSDCSVLTEVHRGHDFVKLSIIKGHYEAQMALKLQDLAALREQASKQAELARGKALPKSTGRLEGVAKFQANMKSLKEQIGKRLRKLLAGTQNEVGGLQERLQQWSEQYEQWIKVLKNSSKGRFIEQEHQLLSEGLADLFQQLAAAENQIAHIRHQIEGHNCFSNYIQPEFQSYTFIVDEFSRKGEDHFYTNAVQTKEGLKLRLKIYPRGIRTRQDQAGKGQPKLAKRQSKTQEYFAVFIELVHAPAGSTKLKHEIALSNQHHGGKLFKRQFESEFDVGLCWGYENYIKLGQLYEEGYYNREFDFLQIQLKIGPHSYYQAAKDQLALLTDKKQLRTAQLKTLRDLRSCLHLKESAETSSDIETSVGPLLL